MATFVRRRPWWLIAAAVVAGLVLMFGITMLVIYPRVAASKVRGKFTGYLAEKLGRTVEVGDVSVTFGHAVIRDVSVRGPNDGETPLVHIDRIDVDFAGWASLIGRVELGDAKVDGVIVALRRGGNGEDNIRDVIEKLRARSSDTGASGEGGSHVRPTSISVTHGKLLANDDITGATALVADGSATWTPEQLVAVAKGLTATTLNAPHASAAMITITKPAGQTPTVKIEGGELSVWEGLALSGIGGTIAAREDKKYAIDLAGGYGGVPGPLWTAKGALDPANLAGVIDLKADRFQLDRLAPILAHSSVVDYQATSIDTALHVDFDRLGAKFSGDLHVHGLNVGNAMIADKEVHDLDLSAQVGGSFDRAKHVLELTRGDFVARDLPFSITGTIIQPPRAELPEVPAVLPTEGPTPPLRGPHGVQQMKLHVVIPPIDCQRMMTAIPTEMAPYMAGYKLRGVFDTDIQLDVDWNHIDDTVLDGHVGINHCRVVDEPADSPKRLKEEFEHYVEVEKGEWSSFVVGPTNEDFVPIDDISQFLIKSIMSTEDSGFYKHRGFITTEFRTALIQDLKAGGFKFGASSITMQMVKNVLLYREKTLARKLQELFLTWHVENTLTKDRIMEIYLNVIEYGPNLYGIGPAAKAYFGKPAKDLNPREAAFFSSILPNPKERYAQYCRNELTKWTDTKIDRILKIMLKRDRLTQEEFDKAMATPLVFAKDGSETEEDCLKRVKKAIKNARSTNPNAPPDPNAPDPKTHHHHKKKSDAVRSP